MAGGSINSIPRMEASPVVQAELAKIRKTVIENTGVTREEIVQLFLEAANFARILGDPMGLIAAGRELGKMLGHYAPEVKKTLHGIDKNELRKALKDMNDDELYKIAHSQVIDGEYTRTTEQKILPGMPAVETPASVLQETPGMQKLHPDESDPEDA